MVHLTREVINRDFFFMFQKNELYKNVNFHTRLEIDQIFFYIMLCQARINPTNNGVRFKITGIGLYNSVTRVLSFICIIRLKISTRSNTSENFSDVKRRPCPKKMRSS